MHYGDVLIKYGPILDADVEELPFITDGRNTKFHNMLLKDGDVIIADTAEDEAVGKATEIINIGSRKVVSGLHTFACRPLVNMTPTYLGFYINSETFHKQLYSLMQGVKVLSISKSNIANTIIRYPHQAEQVKICSLLNMIEARIVKQRHVIELLKKYKRGVSESILTSLSCPAQELSAVCDIIGGGTPDTSVLEYWNGDINWFTPTEVGKKKYVTSSTRTITANGLSKSSAKKLPPYTILLTTRATLGEMSIATDTCCTNQGFQSLVAKRDLVLPEYIYYLQVIIKPWCEKYSSGNTFREISKSALGKCAIPVPSIERQSKIVRCLSLIDAKIENSEFVLENLRSMKSALLQQLFI